MPLRDCGCNLATMNDAIRDRIKAVRLKSGLSAKAFGEQCGLGKSAIGDIESGRRPTPALETMVRIAGHYKVDLWWLATGKEQ